MADEVYQTPSNRILDEMYQTPQPMVSSNTIILSVFYWSFLGIFQWGSWRGVQDARWDCQETKYEAEEGKVAEIKLVTATTFKVKQDVIITCI